MSLDVQIIKQKIEEAVRKMLEAKKALSAGAKAAAFIPLIVALNAKASANSGISPSDIVGAIVWLLAAGFAVVVAAYIISILIHKRMMDSVQSTAAATLTATQSLIATSIYYGAYERSETLRTVAAVIGIDQIRDTALQFQDRYPFGSRNTSAPQPTQ